MKRTKAGVNFNKIDSFYVLPALIFDIFTRKAKWSGGRWHETKLFGIRLRWLLWDANLCIVYRGLECRSPGEDEREFFKKIVEAAGWRVSEDNAEMQIEKIAGLVPTGKEQ